MKHQRLIFSTKPFGIEAESIVRPPRGVLKKSFFCLLLFCSVLLYSQQYYKVPVLSASSTQPSQPGQDPLFAVDGDQNTLYHSLWSSANAIPDQLDFYFAPSGYTNLASS
ncbi:hypothetical protein SAMN05880574_108115 [Chryseobacterium sp. RU37D]|uniref:hypothetical protein n=1 Tax=Chryseobacterium sp. RU37D TaxID=1907397 RepID=UPI000953A7A1|nr:hypothetical protein [Chryseobacterium sp. RU37D]SIQ25079.1 hypothetical protein SAMN05880574_108115 [Chryseobacterium sp. RU37D]